MSFPRILYFLLLFLLSVSSALSLVSEDFRVTYGASNTGKHIVFIAGEREYRSEESLPTLAKILAKHHGFKCTVLFTLADDGTIEPQGPNLKGLEILQDADLLFMFMRFLNLPDVEMEHFDRYVQSGKPIIALRTSTHAFRIPDGPWRKYDYAYEGKEYLNGFGRQVLGETWVAHNGDNHLQSTRLTPVKHQKRHPVLTGVGEMHTQTGSYLVSPREGSWPLVMAQPLKGMAVDSDPHPALYSVPAVWTRFRDVGEKGRVLACTHGASVDLLDDGLRRLLVNACFWALREEDRIKSKLNIEFVGPFKPTEYASWAWNQGVRPSDLEGYSSTIGGGEYPEPPASYLERMEIKKQTWLALERSEP
ncbi:MAG: hypothetical protein O3C43_17850 [Verrucomicrobia bacterium]|nr:hypothetical protein [Verrucomicrobiota bacterium]MDA1068356.1 hypothetical protein [Verrucomicrobiota bacterium]